LRCPLICPDWNLERWHRRNTTAQMMERFGHDVLANHPPTVVILGGQTTHRACQTYDRRQPLGDGEHGRDCARA